MHDRRKKQEKISIFIRRPVTTVMIFLAVLVMGIVSLSRLSQELFPSISYPQITILTPYEGAAPEEVESLITQILEETSGAISGVKQISSISREALSLVMARFDWGTNMDLAALEVREKIDLVKERLPRDCGEPIVMKYNPFERPVIVLSVTAGNKTLLDLREICQRQIKDNLEKIEGVAAAVITGGVQREILVEVNQPRLRASGLSLLDIGSIIKKSNINYPAGSIKGSFYEHLVRTVGEFQTLKEISDLTVLVDVPQTEEEEQQQQLGIEKEKIQEKAARLVRLNDVAQVKNIARDKESISRHNGVQNISISIMRQSGANVIEVCRRVKESVAMLSANASMDVKIEVVYDEAVYVVNAIQGVRNDAVMGGILAFVVLLIFLRNLRFSLIIAVSIPISVIGVFMFMFWRHITLNMISLGGLALGIGMLVDNSIVVLENIFRCQSEAAAPAAEEAVSFAHSRQAVVSRASGQMAGAIFSSTLTTICVFFPMMFLTGIAGQLFKQLAFTIIISLAFSYFIALSLVPMLACGRSEKKTSAAKKDQAPLRKLESFYYKGLAVAVRHRLLLIAFILGIFLASVAVLKTIPQEFMPRLDQRQFTIKLTMEPGTSLEVTDSAVSLVEKVLLKEMPDVKEVSVKVGSDEDDPGQKSVQTLAAYEAEVMVKLYAIKEIKEKGGSSRSTQEVIQELRRILREKNLMNAQLEYVLQESVLKEALESKPIQIEIKGESLLEMGRLADALKEKLAAINGVYSIEDDRVPSSPETKIEVLNDQAALYGLSTQDIALTAHTAVKGRVFTKFKEDITHPIDIRVRLREEDRKDISKIRSLEIRTGYRDVMVPLYQVARIAKGRGPTEIKRVDQRRTITVSANLFGRRISEISKELTSIIKSIKTPLGSGVGLSGESLRMQESFANMRFAFILAALLIYMIMAAQFESLWQPFIIMFTVPFSVIGISLALKLTATSLNIVAFLGVIMLGGIVVNNGIILVDSMNQLRKQGLAVREAVLQAGSLRLQPILMTSLTTILGLTPLALGMGEGAELRSPMAVTVMGGLISSTFLTLIFIPVLYYSVARVIERVKGPAGQPANRSTE